MSSSRVGSSGKGGKRWALLALALLMVTGSSHALYRNGKVWPKSSDLVTYIKVCFIKSGELTDVEDARQRVLVQEVIAATWGRWMKIEFSGFATCTSSPPNNTLAIKLDGDTVNGAGEIPDLSKPNHNDGFRGYHGSPTYGLLWIAGTTDLRARGVITHEIGHGLSFEHEQSRKDAEGFCPDGDSYIKGSNVTPEYDDTGTMNYCTTAAYLSRLDIHGGQSLYEKSAAGVWLEVLPAISRLSLL